MTWLCGFLAGLLAAQVLVIVGCVACVRYAKRLGLSAHLTGDKQWN